MILEPSPGEPPTRFVSRVGKLRRVTSALEATDWLDVPAHGTHPVGASSRSLCK